MRQPAGRSCRARFHRRQVPRTFRRGRPANLFRHTLRAHRLRTNVQPLWLQAVVNQPDGIAERIGIGTAVAAAEKRHLLSAQILRIQLIQKAVPVCPAIACAPTSKNPARAGRISHFAGRRIGHIVYIGVRDAQLFGNIRSHGLGRAHRTAEKDTSHNFVVFGLRQRNSIPTGSSIPDFRGFGAAG